MIRLRRTLLTAALAAAVFCPSLRAQEPADWVDPFIGTTNFGATNPGAVTPNGMMSVVPFNVMGSEEKGISKEVLKLCDEQLAIPMIGHIESLNVSAAAAVMLYEVVRQRIGPEN